MAVCCKNVLFLSLFAWCYPCCTLRAADTPLTVFVFAGQSNMVGKRSKSVELPEAYRGEQSNVLLFDGDRWVPYRAGLGQSAGFGPEVSAALELAKVLGHPVGIIKHSVGGTNLAVQWNPKKEKNLYAALDTKVAAAGKARSIKVAGVFWMQGGADARFETAAAAYTNNLDHLIAAMRRDFGNPALPFVAGRSGRGSTSSNPRYPGMGKVRAGQEKSRPNYAWVDCDEITVGPDHIHYDTPGIVDLGRKMAAKMTLILKPAMEVTEIRAMHRHGQTFVTWKDVAEGEAGANYRYSLYRSDRLITVENLDQAELCYPGVLNNSAKLYGSAFNMADRLDPAKPYSVIEEGGPPLPPWSGLAVRTVREAGRSYYAVVATDEKLNPVHAVAAGKSATTEAIEETPGPIHPIKLYDSKERPGPYVASTQISGEKRLPLRVSLHGSNSRGGGAGDYGDYYLYFGTPQMGYRDGLPGVFSVSEYRHKQGNYLHLRLRDAVEHPSGARAMETYWFGYLCVPHGAAHTEPRVYPFTENQIVWITDWVVERYDANPNAVFIGGSSSGGVGSNNVGLRHPELFAAAYPVVGRVRRVPAVALEGKFDRAKGAMMANGQTAYYDRVDGPKFAAAHHADLPFLGWSCGRHDGWATWQEHIDMVQAMTAAHHGFAFSWNNGNHSGGGRAKEFIDKYYPPQRFAKNRSYPVFGNSSIDNHMGNGDPEDGDPVGGINLGFVWSDVIDEPDRWSVKLANNLAEKEMTVDVTPRRCQKFKSRPGETFAWTNSAGGSGERTADEWGLVTVERIKIQPGRQTVLTIQRQR